MDLDTARTIIEPYFEAAKTEFVDHERKNFSPHSKLKHIRMECRTWDELHEDQGFTTRNFAATTEDGRTIVVTPDIVELPEESVAAIIAHEFGHAYDFLYPGHFVLDEYELLRFKDDDDLLESKSAVKMRVARMKQWEKRDHDMVEAVADAIATEVLGLKIRYTGECMLQTFGPGVRRHRGLR